MRSGTVNPGKGKITAQPGTGHFQAGISLQLISVVRGKEFQKKVDNEPINGYTNLACRSRYVKTIILQKEVKQNANI